MTQCSATDPSSSSRTGPCPRLLRPAGRHPATHRRGPPPATTRVDTESIPSSVASFITSLSTARVRSPVWGSTASRSATTTGAADAQGQATGNAETTSRSAPRRAARSRRRGERLGNLGSRRQPRRREDAPRRASTWPRRPRGCAGSSGPPGAGPAIRRPTHRPSRAHLPTERAERPDHRDLRPGPDHGAGAARFPAFRGRRSLTRQGGRSPSPGAGAAGATVRTAIGRCWTAPETARGCRAAELHRSGKGCGPDRCR
jgi:hypothetical protein